jgi:hypothetical protein
MKLTHQLQMNKQVNHTHGLSDISPEEQFTLYLLGVAVQTLVSDCSLLDEFINVSSRWLGEAVQHQVTARHNRNLAPE